MSAGPGGTGPNEERTVSYQPEERYWTDYLRIALPVVGLLLLIGLLWYWASALIGDGSRGEPPTPALAVITPVNEATPAPPTATAVVLAPTPGPPVQSTPTPVPPVAAATQAPAPTAAAVATEAENPCANLPVYPVGALVTTTDQIRLRDAPSTDGNIVSELPAGTQLQITGDFSEAGECDWWPVIVTATGQSGFVIEQYLKPVPA
jgi:hypothetical protein